MNPDTEDSSVERFARVTPPSGHEARVRARSGPGAASAGLVAHTPTGVAWRWVMPVAASVLVVAGAVWQSTRAARQVEVAAPAAPATWSGKGVDLPVLPPRAYWEMSAVDEFARLRDSRPALAATAPPRRNTAARTNSAVVDVAHRTAGGEPPWSPLPPIELDDIAPAPLEVPAIAGLDPIELEPIHIDPIDIVPVDKEQQ